MISSCFYPHSLPCSTAAPSVMNPRDHLGAHQLFEKTLRNRVTRSPQKSISPPTPAATLSLTLPNLLLLLRSTRQINMTSLLPPFSSKVSSPIGTPRLQALPGLKLVGIARVMLEEKRHGGESGYLQMFALWRSMNLAAANIIIKLRGPLVFQLG